MKQNENTIGISATLSMGVTHSNGVLKKHWSGLSRILLFFSVIATTGTLLHLAINFGITQISTSKFGSLNKVVSGEVNAEIIINGSSRALNHYDPIVIESRVKMNTYNLGMNAIHTDLQLGILKTYLKNNTKPKLVVQNLDTFSLEPTKKGEIHDPATYAPYLNQEVLYRSLVAIDPAVWKWRYFPLFAYTAEDMNFTWARGILGLIGLSGREDYTKGFQSRDLVWSGDFEKFRDNNRGDIIHEIDPDGIKVLRDLVQTCKYAGIQLILVYSPEYQEMQELGKNRNELFSAFQSIANDYQIELWDYSTSNLSKNIENFHNSQHLNKKGATEFSFELAERIKTYLDKSIASSITPIK